MMEIMLRRLRAKPIDDLLIANRSQSRDRQYLGLSAGKEPGSMGSRQEPHLAAHGTNFLHAAPIGTNLLMGDHAADNFLLHFMKDIGNLLICLRIVHEELLHGLRLDICNMGIAVQLVGIARRRIQFCLGKLTDGLLQLLGNGKEFHFPLLLAANRLYLLLELNDFLDFLMAEQDGIEDDILRQLIGTGFHHHDSIMGTRHRKVQRGLLPLFLRGIDDKSIIHTSHTHTGNGPHEGDIRYRQGAGGANHRRQFRRIVLLHGEHRGNNLHIIPETLGKQRANRAVNETGAENSITGGTSLPLDESAGNLAGRIHLFLIINRQREEIDPFPGFCGSRGRHQHHRIAIAHENCAIGLLRHLAVLDGQGASTQLHLKTVHIVSSKNSHRFLLFYMKRSGSRPLLFCKEARLGTSLIYGDSVWK